MTKPQRIQLSRRRGFKLQAASPNGLPVVKVDRSTKWGNPFKPTDVYMTGPKAGQQCGHAGAVEAFRNALENDLKRGTTARPLLEQLRWKNLACWCKLPAPGEPDVCHAAVLIQLANRDAP